ncbi:TetR/AcrR family transcriptional regulator [Spongiibacter sp. KMU-166]|uniref:TetR/AcrR family transcriptional regulator n=1 Tax=Spongiibacter thalassae TaxID=2721624 RepID=A0ABX1GDG7_9GAMM|nr:TetR/AcrR family transcriptional regulator [Spongiibacter thalassae]NKI16437.1 TetR/AcrR family transcriptional regulator [Spongiibacter thalassae]
MTKKTNKTDTISNIITAASAVFAERGLADANIQEIADHAGVTKQLVYHYFQNKNQLFACVIDRSSDDAMPGLIDELNQANITGQPPVLALRKLIDKTLEIYYKNPLMASLADDGIRYHCNNDTPRNQFARLGPELTEMLREILRRGKEEGVFRQDIDPDLLFATIGLIAGSTFTNRYVVNVLGKIDPTTEDGERLWRPFIVDLIASGVEVRNG